MFSRSIYNSCPNSIDTWNYTVTEGTSEADYTVKITCLTGKSSMNLIWYTLTLIRAAI